jgi:hypothetical protein
VLRAHDRGGAPLKWTTTEASLADYLAEQTLQRQDSRHSEAGAHMASTLPVAREAVATNKVAAPFRELYHDICRDYFMAVFLRRRLAHRSANFHRAVLVGQVLGLITLTAAMAGAVGFSFTGTPPEHVVIERWIDEHSDRFQIVRWHESEPAPNGDGVVVRVEYRYRIDGNKSVQTDRRFHVAGESITELVEPD